MVLLYGNDQFLNTKCKILEFADLLIRCASFHGKCRWTKGLLRLLQQPLSVEDMQAAAAAVHAVSAISLFVQHIQADAHCYVMLATGAGALLQSGNR